MKPKTAIEHRIVDLSAQLPAITSVQLQPAFAKCFENHAVQSRKTLFCLECGHQWKLTANTPVTKTECENCHKKLTVTPRYDNGLQETDYCQIITASKDFQIVRVFCLSKTMKKNKASSFFWHEVMQLFIDEQGKVRSMSKNVMGMSRYYDQWVTHSTLTLKNYHHNRFYLRPGYVFPNKKILPLLKRNGFKTSFHGIAPQVLFRALLTDSIAETLLKSKQHDLLRYHIDNTSLKPDGIYWNAAKICIRNGYIIKDAKLWVDYLDLLDHFQKDLRSPKYLCPANLENAHNRLMAKKRAKIIRQTLERKKSEIARNQKFYFKAKQRFFGLVFTEKNISISVIETVREFLEEGSIHNHCVFTNDYYKKENSLILSAKVNGTPMETVQVSLEKFEVLQSRGLENKASRHNKAILSLVQRNMHHIKARMKKAA